MDNLIRPYFEANIDASLHKNMVIEIEDQEFYVKYSRPFFGKISNGTEIKIDNSVPRRIQSLRIAPIWETQEIFDEAISKQAVVQEFLKQNYLIPNFYGGFMSFVEKGEGIQIDNLEFFVNDCRPKMGIVDMQTIIEVEVGFTRELFNKKQVLADKRIAERM